MKKQLKYILTYIICFCMLIQPYMVYAKSTDPYVNDTTDTTTESSGTTDTTTESNGTTDTTASGSTATTYDGSALDNPVCDSGYSNSFSGAEYYDMAIPYALTNKEIGGYSIGSKSGNNAMSVSDQEKKCAEKFNREGDHTSQAKGSYILRKCVRTCTNITISDNSDGMCVAKDTNGTEYYIVAIPKFFFNSTAQIEWDNSMGQIIEIYFTDGKYIRAILGDAKAVGHTNGGIGDEHKPETFDGGAHTYTFAELKYKQYQNIFQAYAGETFEWFCLEKGSNRSNTAALAGSTGSPAFVRMYNLKITDGAPTLNSNESATATGVKTTTGSNVGSSTQSQANSNGYAGGLYAENYFATQMFLSESNWETEINMANRDDLSVQELEKLSDWELMAQQDNTTFVGFMRRIIALIGILLILWGLFLYLAYWFDTINTLIPFQLVPILSFGKLEVLNDEETTFSLAGERDKTKRVTVNHKNIITVCILLVLAGVFVLSGFIYTIIGALYHKAKSFYY